MGSVARARRTRAVVPPVTPCVGSAAGQWVTTGAATKASQKRLRAALLEGEPAAKAPRSKLDQLEPQVIATDEVLQKAKAQETPSEAEKKTPELGLVRPAIGELSTVIVNLERRPDRLQGCLDRLKAVCPELKCSRFEATDGKVTRIPESEVIHSWHTARNCVYQRIRSQRKGWNDLDSYRELTLKLSPGERGCASSHINAWRRCLELAEASGTERPLLVLEDDAAPTPEFRAILGRALATTPSDAHCLYLGYSQAADWRREVSQDVVEAEYLWTTVAYVIWPAGARLLLSKLPVDQPVDNWMAGYNASGELKAYATRPKIVRQAEAWNVNSDVAHSDEHYWGPDSDIHHSDEFYWGTLPPASGAQAGEGGSEQPGTIGTLASGSLWEAGSEASDDSGNEMEDLNLNL